MTGWLSWGIGLLTFAENTTPIEFSHFPLLSLQQELIVIVLRHLVLLEFEDFRNTLLALPDLNELVICLTNCPEAASGILEGVQCVREHEYERIMSNAYTKKPLSIMIVSPYVPHREEDPRLMGWMGAHPLFTRFYFHIRDTVVETFITLDPLANNSVSLRCSDALKSQLKRFKWLKKFPSRCSCPQPCALINLTPEPSSDDLRQGSESGSNTRMKPQIRENEILWLGRGFIYPDRYISRMQSEDPWPGKGFILTGYSANLTPHIKEAENLWLGGGLLFPCVLMSKYELFPRLKHFYLDIPSRPFQYVSNCSDRVTRVNFEAPVLQTLTINFWTLQCPIINVSAPLPNGEHPRQKCCAKNLVVQNMYWSPTTPSGLKKGCYFPNHDQFQCSTASFNRLGVNLSSMFESYVLTGVPDTFLVHARWDCVKSLYWKRLEPSHVRDRPNEIVLRCPSLKHLKIFHLVSNKVPLIKFDAPVVEQLILVSLPGTDQPWNVHNLLNNQWPRTLSKLTVSPDYWTLSPENMIFPNHIVAPEPLLTHLWIQRVDLTPHVENIIFRHLVYLDLDVTAIVVTRSETDPATRMRFNHSQCPVLKVLILSVPLLTCTSTTIIGVPVLVCVPETCESIGVATMLAMRAISVNGQALERPPNFMQRPHLELFTRYTKEDGRFVANGEMMAGRGESLDLLIDSQQRDFDHEKKHFV